MDRRIALRGEIDLASAPDALRRLDEAIDGHPGDTVVVDLTKVSFVDSSGLGVFVACDRRARVTGGRVVLDGCAPAVRRVLDVTGLARVLLPEPCGSAS